MTTLYLNDGNYPSISLTLSTCHEEDVPHFRPLNGDSIKEANKDQHPMIPWFF